MLLLVTDMPSVQSKAAGACLLARTQHDAASLSMPSLWLRGHKMTSSRWSWVSCQDGNLLTSSNPPSSRDGGRLFGERIPESRIATVGHLSVWRDPEQLRV